MSECCRLSEMTEKETDRTSLVNMTRVTEKFMTSLLATLVDGSIIDTGESLQT